jgi:multidrug transporter EmrE-like cation transporter
MKYIIAAIGVFLTVAAQVFMKKTSYYEFFSGRFVSYILMSMGAYCLAFLAQAYVMKIFPLSKISPVMSIATMILIFVCGIFIFDEQIHSKQIIGIILGIGSIYLILS